LCKSQFESILIGNDLLGYVDGSFPCLPKLINDQNGTIVVNTSYSTWVKIDQCVHSLVNPTLTIEIFHEVHDLRTSQEIWLALGQCFTYRCATKEIGLKLDFQNTVKKSDQSMFDNLQHMKSIEDSLTTINYSISNKDLVIQGFNGLPSDQIPLSP